MRLQSHADAPSFLEAATPVLAADEARHNLIYGICSTLVDTPDAYPEAHLWTIHAEDVVGAAVMTPPFNILVAQPLDPDVLPFAARTLHEGGIHLPGVTGALPEVDAFARTWVELTGARQRTRMSQGIYAARTVQMPSGVAGRARPVQPSDRALVVDWLRAFQAEALEEDAPHVDLEAVVERRLASENSGFTLWEDDARPVSLCGFGGRTPTGIRIGPVYTPPDLRRRGYGSALTAHVTKEQLDGDRDYCFLYTDLTNPTSNRIYMQIGYERVADSAEYVFESA